MVSSFELVDSKMMRSLRQLGLFKLAPIVALFAFCSQIQGQEQAATAGSELKEFVKIRDDSYRFEIVEERTASQSTVYRLHLVSQTWKETTWKHVVWMAVPNKLLASAKEKLSPGTASPSKLTTKGLLFITGGGWDATWGEKGPEKLEPRGEAQAILAIAEATNSPAVIISQVPFQPMLNGLYEDALIAETFKRYILGQGSDWPLLMPMVRAAARAMDTAQSVASDKWNIDIEKFTVSGASKRGWTTWLTSAVDPRVDALAPMVIDMLNMPAQMKHQVDTWGTYSEEIGDYTNLQLPKFLQTPPGKALVKIVDPFAYRQSLTQPKVLIFGTNDRYWPLDACNLYWSELSGPKYLLYTPNQPHSIRDIERLVGTMSALHKSRLGQGELPKLEWKSETANGKVRWNLRADRKPIAMSLWIATSKTRDFRDSTWTSRDVQFDAENACQLEENIPETGYQAWFVEWKFENGAYPAYFSTNIVLPTQK